MNKTIFLSLLLCCAGAHAAVQERCVHGAQIVPSCVSKPFTASSLNASCGTTCQVMVTTDVFLQTVVVTVSTVEVGSPAFLNLTVTNTFASGATCATDVNTAGMQVFDALAANYYANYFDYETVSVANRPIFPTFGNELIVTATDSVLNNNFGFDIALSGDGSTLVVGAPDRAPAGVAYIFERQPVSWAQVLEIPNPIGGVGGNFGNTVAISHDGSVIVIGDGQGHVYLYSYNPSTNVLTLNQTLTVGSISGLALSASGQYLVVYNNATPPQIFIYERQNSCAGLGTSWALQQTLATQPVTAGGIAVSGDGTVIAAGVTSVGAPGVVLLYTLNNGVWSHTQTLTASDGVANDGFGIAVAVSGNGKYITVGADNRAPRGEGYAFVRRGQSWLQEHIFLPNGSGAAFGTSTAISDDGTVAVFGDFSGAATAGQIYVALRSPDNVWQEQFVFTGTGANQELGFPVAISRDGAFIAGGATNFFNGPGSVYMFSPIGSFISSDAIITGSLCVYNQTTVNGDLYVTGSIYTNGFVVSGGVTPCVPSDRAIKKNIQPLSYEQALKKLQLLRPVAFTWKNPEEHVAEGKNPAGFIAQDVREHFPHWVTLAEPTGADKELIPAGEQALHLAITPEIFAYFVAVVKQLYNDNAQQHEQLKPLLLAAGK